MLTRIAVATLAFVLPAFATDTSATAPEPITVGFNVGPTQFTAKNYSADTQVLLFRSGDILTWRKLLPGSVFFSTYARQALDGVQLEVASYVDGAWHASGALNMSAICDLGADAFWIQNGNPSPVWEQIGTTLSACSVDPSFLPGWVPTGSGDSPPAPLMQPVHVPVTTPMDGPHGDLPPKLDDVPLPPF